MNEDIEILCRFCICKCEDPRNMTVDLKFLCKVEKIFTDIEVSRDNYLPTLVCGYCYNLITQFYTYYESVMENQKKILEQIQNIFTNVQTDHTDIKSSIKMQCDENCTESYSQNFIASPATTVSELDDEKEQLEKIMTKQKATRTKRSKEKEPKQANKAQCLSPVKTKKNKIRANNCDTRKFYICDYCQIWKTTRRDRIIQHLFDCKNSNTKAHKIKPSYKIRPAKELLTIPCSLCPPAALKFKNNTILQLHLKEHAKMDRLDESRVQRGLPKMVPCHLCERRFRNVQEYHVHAIRHTQDLMMTCELCGRSIVEKNLIAHLSIHQKKLMCEHCAKPFKSYYVLRDHVQQVHMRPEYYECHYCNKKIRKMQKLKNHIARCRGPDTPWPCKHCGLVFESHSKRMYHVRNFHLGFRCKRCGIQVQTSTQLKNHYKSEEHKETSRLFKLRKAMPAENRNEK